MNPERKRHLNSSDREREQDVRVKAETEQREWEEEKKKEEAVRALDPTVLLNFSLALFRKSNPGGGKNLLLSPMSVYMALAMTANGAERNTKAELERTLGMSVVDINNFLSIWRTALPVMNDCQVHLANAVWLNKDLVKENCEFTETVRKYYDSQVRILPFDRNIGPLLNQWVNEKTDGMIESLRQLPTALDPMCLVNAVSFDAKWMSVYYPEDLKPGLFTTENGKKKEVTMMYMSEKEYLSDENTTGFLKRYKDSDFAFAALLPAESVSIHDYISSLTTEKVLALLRNGTSIEVRTAMPRFQAEFEGYLTAVLKDLGIRDLFDGSCADLSSMGNSSIGRLFCSDVFHQAVIKVNESGTKAAAVTVELMFGSAPPLYAEYKTVTLDRPFVYLIIDTRNNLPLFMGTLMAP